MVILNNSIINLNNNGQIIIENEISNENMLLCITDNGVGIKKRLQDKLFKRYEMSNEIERKIGGGLGLYLSRLIIEAHGGKIWYDSSSTIGAKFCLHLPISLKKIEKTT